MFLREAGLFLRVFYCLQDNNYSFIYSKNERHEVKAWMACVVHALDETKEKMKGTCKTHGTQQKSKNRNKKR